MSVLQDISNLYWSGESIYRNLMTYDTFKI